MDEFDPYELEVLRSKTNKNSNLDFEDDFLICECMCINFGEIKKHLKDSIDFDFLREEYGLGTGCKSCIKTLRNKYKVD